MFLLNVFFFRTQSKKLIEQTPHLNITAIQALNTILRNISSIKESINKDQAKLYLKELEKYNITKKSMNRKFYKVVLDSSVPQEDDIAYSSPFPDDFDINDIRIISTKSFNKYTNVIYKFSDKVKLSGFQIEQVPNEITKYCPTPKSIKLKISVDEEDVEIDVKPGKKIDLSDSDEMKKIVLMLENNPNNKFLCFGKTIINYTE